MNQQEESNNNYSQGMFIISVMLSVLCIFFLILLIGFMLSAQRGKRFFMVTSGPGKLVDINPY